MFWSALVILPTLGCVYDYIYPGKLKKVMLKVGWNTIEYYTRIEMKVTAVYNTYMPRFIAKKERQAAIKIIADGTEIAHYSLPEFQRADKSRLNYDFILYEIPMQFDAYETYDTYVVRYENVNDVMEVEYSTGLKCIELNAMQISVNKRTYNIEFGRKQYMLNGNVLFDRHFLKWYLKVHCGVTLQPGDTYMVTFIDQHMNYITLPEYCYIYVKKNNYEIVNVIKNDINK
jgi:hypothetical protein